MHPLRRIGFFFFQAEDGIRDIGVTGVQTCALPISVDARPVGAGERAVKWAGRHPAVTALAALVVLTAGIGFGLDRKSTRLNSSHANISYAVFCLKKKKKVVPTKQTT